MSQGRVLHIDFSKVFTLIENRFNDLANSSNNFNVIVVTFVVEFVKTAMVGIELEVEGWVCFKDSR